MREALSAVSREIFLRRARIIVPMALAALAVTGCWLAGMGTASLIEVAAVSAAAIEAATE